MTKIKHKASVSEKMKDKMLQIKNLLAAKDLRLTTQRELVLQILFEHPAEHLTAEEIYFFIKQKNPDIGIATVYRTLELFSELEIIYKLSFAGDCSRYELTLNEEGHYHHHLICKSCGRIIEFNADLLDDIEKIIGETSNFLIVDHCLRFYGYCADCQEK